MSAGATTTAAGRAVRGVAWSSASVAAVRGLSLVTTAILAHLLSPREFGLVALALVVTAGLDTVRDLGVGQALVVAATDDLASQADAAFAFTVVVALLLAALAAALSPLAASFFRQPALLPLLAVLGLNLPLRGLGRTHYALAQRDLDFRARALAEAGEAIVRGAVGIMLAIGGLGAWSLVLSYLAGAIVWTVLLWSLVHWRPTLHPRMRALRPMMRFGGAVTVVGVVGVSMSYVDNLFVGRVLGASALGTYNLGFRLAEMLLIDLLAAGGLVLFPAFAQTARPALPGQMATSFGYGLLFALPVAVGLITLADPLVTVLFGRRWHAAVPVIQILAIGFAGAPFAIVAGNAYMAVQRVDVLVRLAVPQGLLLVGSVAVLVHHGIAAVAACQTASRLLIDIIGVAVAVRLLDLRPREVWRSVWPPAAAAAGAAAGLVALREAVDTPWVVLLTGVLLGGAIYLGLAWLFARDALTSLWSAARGTARRHDPADHPAPLPLAGIDAGAE